MSSTRVLTVAAITLLSTSTWAQTLLRDFNPTASTEAGHADPSNFQPMPGGRQLFTMTTYAAGHELWITDGTQTGTTMVRDIWPGKAGSFPRQFLELSPGVYLFTADTANEGWELWRTDGTAAGTTLVRDVRPGREGSYATELRRIGNDALFLADDGVHGREVWHTDGTAAGTQLLLDLAPGAAGMSNGSASIATLGSGEAVFTALTNSQWHLYKTDGTAAGTTSLFTFQGYTLFGPRRLLTFGNQVLFEARHIQNSDELWVTDGTVAGTRSLGVDVDGVVQVVGSTAFFRSYSLPTGVELWRTDGTPAGTNMVVELIPGGGSYGGSNPQFLGGLQIQAGQQPELLFYALTPAGTRLFRSDGTQAGTVPIGGTVPAASYVSIGGTVIGNDLYFRVFSGGVTPGLYRTDGTASGTQLVTDLDVQAVADAGGVVMLSGDDGTQVGRELWTTGGTPGTTQLFWDLVPSPRSLGSSPVVLGTFRDRAVVHVETPATGRELWTTDGTPGGTRPFFEFEPGPGSCQVSGFAADERRMLLFVQSTSSDGDPWLSDGSAATMTQLDILPANSGFFGGEPFAFDGRFLFRGHLPGSGSEPWVTDGTVAGTFQLADVVPGPGASDPRTWMRVGDRVVFVTYDYPLRRVWVTDGTTAGTQQLTALQSATGGLLSYNAAPFADRVWFANGDGSGVELWNTDGTVAGTTRVLDLAPGAPSSSPHQLTPVGDRLFLVATIAGAQSVVATDGTPANTVVLPIQQPEVVKIVAIGDDLAGIVTNDPQSTVQRLYRSDGSIAGTSLVGEYTIWPYADAVSPGVDRALMVMDDGSTGQELYSTDGTAAGTFRLFDLAPGSGQIAFVTRVGDRLVFRGDDGMHGAELFSVPFADTGDWAVEGYGTGCPGTGGLTPQIGLGGTARVAAALPFSIDLRSALPNTLAVLGLAQRRGALPIPGCTLWLDVPFSTVTIATDASGVAALPIVPRPALLGLRFDAQYLALDPQGSALGLLSSTGGLEFVIGM